MRNVSSEFIQTMKERRNFTYLAEITFADGRNVELGDDDLQLSGSGIVSGSGQNTFPLGTAAAQRLTIQIANRDGRYEDYDFVGAVFRLWLKFALSETTESIYLGKFTVISPETYGSTITVTATDDMYKADRDYSTSLTYPVAMGVALRDSCATCGLPLLTTVPENADYMIRQKPQNLTHRQFIGLCAMIASGNAVCDAYGRVKILTYDFSAFETAGSCDGGIFDGAMPYETGDSVDGGSFNPWDVGDEMDAGSFRLMSAYHVFFKNVNMTAATDDVQITGIKSSSDEAEYVSGTDGYVLSISNQLITGNEQDAVERIGRRLIGLKFRPFTIDHICYPLAEFGDLCYVVDRKGDYYRSVVTDIDFDFHGFTTVKCSAESPLRNSSKYPARAETEAVIKARTHMEKQISQYDQVVQQMTQLISQGFGMYLTPVEQENGGMIWYLHDKPTIKESGYVCYHTSNGIVASTNGGVSWAIDKNGNALVKVLTAVGIQAEWIDTRGLIARDNSGKVTFQIDAAAGKVTVSGELVGATGSFSGGIRSSQVTGSTIDGGSIFGTYIRGTTISTRGSADGRLEGITISASEEKFDADSKLCMYNWPSDLSVDSPYYEKLLEMGTIFERDDYFDPSNTDEIYEPRHCAYIKTFHNGLLVDDLQVTGKKSRVAGTEHYGVRSLYCYEMPTPLFADIGAGRLDETGSCYVEIDDVFSETVNLWSEYFVFLQKEGNGDVWVAEKEMNYFLVRGTPGLAFAWEIKAVQRGYEELRLEDAGSSYYSSDEDAYQDESYMMELDAYEKEMEGVYDE